MSDENTAPVLRSTKNSHVTEKISDMNEVFKERDIKSSARKEGKHYVDLKNIPLSHDALRLSNWDTVARTKCVPFLLQGKKLSLACVKPDGDEATLTQLALKKHGYKVEIYQCSEEGIQSTKRTFDKFVEKQQAPEVRTVANESEDADITVTSLFEGEEDVFSSSSGPEMMNSINIKAIEFRASDIHFQPEKNDIVIRMRRDGTLHEVLRVDQKQYVLISGELKRSARLKINVRNIPQDGEYDFDINDRQISARVSTMPSKHGESIVVRILDKKRAITDLNSMGFADNQKEIIEKYLKRQRGLILVTGPTGSGKTSTLYSCLQFVNTPEKKIITLENPVEYKLDNIIQSEISEEDEFTFASGLRAALRHDPDVIMVGEIRQKDSGEIALQASLTGHLVLSTLHTNSALGAIPRMVNMGIKPFILSSGLELVIAQRLIRRLCEHCKKAVELNSDDHKPIIELMEKYKSKGHELPESKQVFEGTGCSECRETGYNGRIMVAELLPVSREMKQLISNKKTGASISQLAEDEGFVSMAEHTLKKVLNGETSLEELWKLII
ncbi:MAG: GspE/PulE family protein [Candidatus Gracilibacteria bacterium]|nr:GspE/PulE family protein [Candidatus Gracilibacteria bacterium]